MSAGQQAVTTAVILAAGRGTRLAGELQDCPKGFLRLGTRTIIEESIDRLVAAGISDVVIVTGHCAGHYEDLAKRRAGLLRVVHNPRYAESGSMYSLWCARDLVQGPFLLLESDLVYEPRALQRLLVEPAADAILLSGPTGAGDEVYVELRDGCLHNMSKQAAALGSPPAGELVGISKISAELFRLMCAIAERAFATSLHFDYETDCLVAAGRERPIVCPVLADLVWGEIDDPSHLARVRQTVYPEILRRTAASVAVPSQ
jgi:2-aminoethylphosphonate-pyruvate transaminase